MFKILLAVFSFTVFAFAADRPKVFQAANRPKDFQAAFRRVAHPGFNSGLKLAQEVVQQLQDYEKWLSRIAAASFSDCVHLKNCSNTKFFECLAENIQSIIEDCGDKPEITDPDQLFNKIDERLQFYLHSIQNISTGCSSDLSFHWTSLMKFAAGIRIRAVCQGQGQTNAKNCSDLLIWAAKAQRESIWTLIRKKSLDKN